MRIYVKYSGDIPGNQESSRATRGADTGDRGAGGSLVSRLPLLSVARLVSLGHTDGRTWPPPGSQLCTVFFLPFTKNKPRFLKKSVSFPELVPRVHSAGPIGGEETALTSEYMAAECLCAWALGHLSGQENRCPQTDAPQSLRLHYSCCYHRDTERTYENI